MNVNNQNMLLAKSKKIKLLNYVLSPLGQRVTEFGLNPRQTQVFKRLKCYEKDR